MVRFMASNDQNIGRFMVSKFGQRGKIEGLNDRVVK